MADSPMKTDVCGHTDSVGEHGCMSSIEHELRVALRAALERAQKAEAQYDALFEVHEAELKAVQKALQERDAAMAKLDECARFFNEYGASAHDVRFSVLNQWAKKYATERIPLRSDLPPKESLKPCPECGRGMTWVLKTLPAWRCDYCKADWKPVTSIHDDTPPKTAPDNQMDYPPAAVHLDRSMVSIHGSDGCSNCETGRITIYAASRWCLECQAKSPTRQVRE